MYSLLIVEDENIIRVGLKRIIQKLNLGINDIFEAKDGIEGLKLVKEMKPDILITDIKMPDMDGIKLIESLHAGKININIIILSGYGEFNYSQKAIQFGVKDYLLKPIKKDKLYIALSNIINEIDNKKLQEELREQQSLDYKKTVSEYQKNLLKSILLSYVSQEENAILEKAGLFFPNKGFVVFTVRFGSGNSSLNSMELFINNTFNQAGFTIYSFEIKYSRLVFLVNIDQDEVAGLEAEVSGIFSKSFMCTYAEEAYIGMSEWNSSMESLPELFNQSIAALDFRLFDWNTRFIRFSVKFYSKGTVSMLTLYTESVINAIANNNNKDIINAVDNLFKHFLNSDILSPKYLIDTIKKILYELKYQEVVHNDWDLDMEYLYQTSNSLLEFRERLKMKLLSCIDDTEMVTDTSDNNAINYVISYLQKNYYKDISLDMAANLISMNSNYFSTIFKRKTGFSFIKYLHALRIEESKKLLADPSVKIYEIALKVGFMNEKYFFKIFKEVTGLTPSEYRSRCNLTF